MTETRTLARERRRPRLLLPIIAVLLLAAALLPRLLAPDAISGALPDLAQDFVTLTLSVIVESFPFIIVGIALSVIVQVWLPADTLPRLLPGSPALRRMTLSFLGILLPVCECGNVPLARGLMLRGLSVAEALTFLVAAPVLNPVTIITTYQAFGFDHGILVARIAGGFVIANLLGWLFSRHPSPDALLTRRFADACAAHGSHDETGSSWRRAARLFVDETRTLLPALIVGAIVAGLIQVALTRDVLLALGQNPLLSVLALMGLAFIVALCSSVDAFFALSLASTFMPGAIVAFLLFGPIIDVKMIALLRTTFTARTITTITVVVALAVLVIGLGVNLVA